LLFILFVIFISLSVINFKNTFPPENFLKDAISNNKIENKDDTVKNDQILFTDKTDSEKFLTPKLLQGTEWFNLCNLLKQVSELLALILIAQIS